MVLEKKLLVFSVLAIVIGVASIAPLPFLMSGKANASADGTDVKAQFSLNIPYVFIRINGPGLKISDIIPDSELTEQLHNLFHKDTFSGTLLEESKVFNITSLANSEEELPDAAVEYFNYKIYTDKEILANFTYYYGGAYNSSFKDQTFFSFAFNRDNWSVDSQQYNNATRGSFGTLKPNQGHLSVECTGTSDINVSETPQRIYISISRVATVLFYDNSTVVSLSNAGLIQQITLEKFQDGYLYNTLFTEQQLSQMDLRHPKV